MTDPTEKPQKRRRSLDEQIADLERSRRLGLSRLLAKEQLRLATKALNTRKQDDAAGDHALKALLAIIGMPTVNAPPGLVEQLEALKKVLYPAENGASLDWDKPSA